MPIRWPLARTLCLRLLTERARSRHELALALRRKGVPEPAAGVVLDRFDEVGLVDDAAFAEQWVHSRHTGKGLGRRALAVELRRKGVADDVAGNALQELDVGAEEQRARGLVDRKLRGMRSRLAGTPGRRRAAARRDARPQGLRRPASRTGSSGRRSSPTGPRTTSWPPTAKATTE